MMKRRKVLSDSEEVTSLDSVVPQKYEVSEYWIRLCLLVEDHVKDALLGVLHNRINDKSYDGLPEDPTELYTVLMQQLPLLKQLRSRKIITEDQWYLLFPHNKRTKSVTLDISIIVILIRHCTTLQPPTEGWAQKMPAPSDQSRAANALRARELRNYVYHYGAPNGMPLPEFLAKWAEGDLLLVGLGYKGNNMNLKTGLLHPHKELSFNSFTKYIEIAKEDLKKAAISDDAIKQISAMNQKQLTMENMLTKVMSDFGKLRAEIKQQIDDQEAKKEQEQQDEKTTKRKRNAASIQGMEKSVLTEY